MDLLIQDLVRKTTKDGWGFARLLRSDQDLCNIPFLIASAYLAPACEDQLAMIDKFLPLPSEMEEFLDTVERLLAKPPQAKS